MVFSTFKGDIDSMRLENIKEVYVRWISIPILALLIVLLVDKTDHHTFIENYFIALFFVMLFWNGAFIIFIHFRKRYPLIKQTPKRLLFTLLSLSIFLLAGDSLLCSFLHGMTYTEMLEAELLFKYAPVNFITSFIIGSIYENVYFFEQWKKTIQVNEALKNQQIRTQFEVLQNQMSPHFLFNSLNTLATLISENQENAIHFTEKLSEVYRYILQNKERELVKLEEELEFAKAYVYLLGIRYPENLCVEFEIDPRHNHLSIAPLTLQILIENAIKHNIVSKANPLFIRIYIAVDSIVVINNYQLKSGLEKSTKTGLSNIKKRYEYLGKSFVDVSVNAESFKVSVPLIDLLEEKDLNLNAAV